MKERAKEISSEAELSELKKEYLGNKGKVQKILRTLKDLHPDDRTQVGAKANAVQKILSDFFDQGAPTPGKLVIMEDQLSEEEVGLEPPPVYVVSLVGGGFDLPTYLCVAHTEIKEGLPHYIYDELLEMTTDQNCSDPFDRNRLMRVMGEKILRTRIINGKEIEGEEDRTLSDVLKKYDPVRAISNTQAYFRILQYWKDGLNLSTAFSGNVQFSDHDLSEKAIKAFSQDFFKIETSSMRVKASFVPEADRDRFQKDLKKLHDAQVAPSDAVAWATNLQAQKRTLLSYPTKYQAPALSMALAYWGLLIGPEKSPLTKTPAEVHVLIQKALGSEDWKELKRTLQLLGSVEKKSRTQTFLSVHAPTRSEVSLINKDPYRKLTFTKRANPKPHESKWVVTPSGPTREEPFSEVNAVRSLFYWCLGGGQDLNGLDYELQEFLGATIEDSEKIKGIDQELEEALKFSKDSWLSQNLKQIDPPLEKIEINIHGNHDDQKLKRVVKKVQKEMGVVSGESVAKDMYEEREKQRLEEHNLNHFKLVLEGVKTRAFGAKGPLVLAAAMKRYLDFDVLEEIEGYTPEDLRKFSAE